MNELPNGWVETEIGEIARIETGNTPPKDDPRLYGREVCFYKPGDLDVGGVVSASNDMVSQAGADAGRLLPADTLLVTCIGNLGKSALIAAPAICNQQINAVLPSPVAGPRYLYHWSRTIKPWLEDNSSATTVSIINKGRFSKAPIRIAPLPEQRRIVAKIDSLTGKTRRARDHLDHIPRLVEKYKQAVLAAAFRGDLTREWRSERPNLLPTSQQYLVVKRMRTGAAKPQRRKPTASIPDQRLPDTWAWLSPDELADNSFYSIGIGPFGSNLIRADYRDSGVRLVFVRDIRRQCFDDQGAHFVTPEKAEELKPHIVLGGDVLITKMGDPPGDTALYPPGASPAIITSDCIKLRPHPSLALAPYLALCIRCDLVQRQLGEITKGVAQQKVSLDGFRQLAIPTPALEEQAEIVRRLETMFTWIDRIASEATSARRLIDHLDQSVLAKAFRGELVPQDPADEPADVLLERIRAERSATSDNRRVQKVR